MYFCNVLNILPSHTTICLRQALRWPPGVPPLLWIPWPLSVARPGDILLMKRMWQNGVMSLPRLGYKETEAFLFRVLSCSLWWMPAAPR